MDYFDKGAAEYSFLDIRESKGNTYFIREIDIALYAYTPSFLESVDKIFPGKAPSRYFIREKVRYGRGKLKKDGQTVEVEFDKFSLRTFESQDLLSALEGFGLIKPEQTAGIREKNLYTFLPEGGIWKSEEVEYREGQTPLRWRHFSEGGMLKSFAYTEFSPNKSNVQYSRIYMVEDYLFKKLSTDAAETIRLFQNKEHILYYHPADKLSMEELNSMYSNKNKAISFFKTDFPIIIYKKKETTDDSKN